MIYNPSWFQYHFMENAIRTAPAATYGGFLFMQDDVLLKSFGTFQAATDLTGRGVRSALLTQTLQACITTCPSHIQKGFPL